MTTTYRPTLVLLPLLLTAALTADAAIMTYSGSQGSKGDETFLIDNAGIVPAIGTGPGTPGGALAAFSSAIDPIGSPIGFEGSTAGAPGTISFGGNAATFSDGMVIDGNLLDPVDFALGRYNMTGYNPDGTSTGALPAIGSEPDLGKWLEAIVSFNITFASPIQAFGFFTVDFSDFGGSVDLILWDENNAEVARTTPPSSDGVNAGLGFFGVTSATAFQSVTFEILQPQQDSIEVLGFDELIFGNLRNTVVSVPAPGTFALMLLGLAGLGWKRRKQT